MASLPLQKTMMVSESAAGMKRARSDTTAAGGFIMSTSNLLMCFDEM